MDLTKEEVEFIEDCLAYYLANEEQFVSYDEYMVSQLKVNKILDKIKGKDM